MAILPLIGLGLGLLNLGSQAKADESSLESQEAVFRFNAAQTKRKAVSVRRVGAEDEFQLRTELREQVARNRVAGAAAGVEAVGSPLEAELLTIKSFAGDIATLGDITREASQDLELQAREQLRQAEDARRAKRRTERSPGGFVGKVLGKIF